MNTWQKLKQNPALFPRYFVKEYIIQAIRKFFEDRHYHELESPILAPALPQERYLDVLETTIELKQQQKKQAYLLPTTETFNKKILAAGLGEHFVISKVMRGLEEISPNHSPEFTMLEWYHLNTDYFGLMQDTEELLVAIKHHLDDKFERPYSPVFNYQGQAIDLTPPWPRISIPDALLKYAQVDLKDIQTVEQLTAVLIKKGYKFDHSHDWQTLFELLFLNEVESQFPKDKPAFVYNYPRLLGPLCMPNKVNPLVCEKVEVYLAGKEIANGYTEQRDWHEQEQRFLEEQQARQALGLKDVAYDHDLIDALKSGLPPVAGIGMGIDRLAMILADAKTIADINYFPAAEMFS